MDEEYDVSMLTDLSLCVVKYSKQYNSCCCRLLFVELVLKSAFWAVFCLCTVRFIFRIFSRVVSSARVTYACVDTAGKKVLHVDRNNYYGGDCASLNLTNLWEKFRPGMCRHVLPIPRQTQFKHSKVFSMFWYVELTKLVRRPETTWGLWK